MRIHGTIYADPAGQRPLRAWARDADDEDRLTPIELFARGNQVLLKPAVVPEVVTVDALPVTENVVPVQRSTRLGDDFT